jgi:ABC-type bacteriocin/lantibiotic exporter with double-glycine peptidase domain
MKTFLQQDPRDCGIACLRSILHFNGHRSGVDSLRQLAATTTSGTSLLGLRSAAGRLGFAAKALTAELEDLSGLELPCILHWDGTHFVILWKVQKGKALIGDPALGKNIWWTLEAVGKHWTGKFLQLQVTEQFERGNFVGQRGWAGLVQHFGQFRGSTQVLLEMGLGTLILALLGLSAPILSQVLFDRVLTFREEQLLPYLLAGIFILSGFQTAFGAVRGYISSHLAMRLDYRLHLGYWHHLLRLPLRQHETRLVGDLLQRFSDLTRIRGILSSLIVALPSSVLSLVVSVALLITYNPTLALVASVNIPLQLAYLFILSPMLRENSKRSLKKSGEVQSFLIGSLEGLSTLKAWRAEEWALLRGRQQLSESMQLGWQGMMLNTWGGVVFGLLGSLGNMLVLWFGAMQVLKLDLTVGQLVAASGLMGNALGALSGITSAVMGIQEGIVASDRLAEILEAQTESDKGIRELLPLEKTFEVRGLKFGYLPELPILKNVSFTLQKGSYTALLGANGSGKSTLATILARMQDCLEGSLLWDGVPLSDVAAGAARERILYLRQDVPLFATTLRENLCLGADFTDQQLWAVLGAVGLEQMARRLPDGLDTQVGGESLFKLSSGEKQMLGLARALCSPADVLILDEPTATLDMERERRVVQILSQLKTRKTLLVITHRPALIEPADVVLGLEDGVVRVLEKAALGMQVLT